MGVAGGGGGRRERGGGRGEEGGGGEDGGVGREGRRGGGGICEHLCSDFPQALRRRSQNKKTIYRRNVLTSEHDCCRLSSPVI